MTPTEQAVPFCTGVRPWSGLVPATGLLGIAPPCMPPVPVCTQRGLERQWCLCRLGDNPTRRRGDYLQPWNRCLDRQGPALRQGIQRARPVYWSPNPGITQREGSSQLPTKKEQPSSKELVIRRGESAVFLSGYRWDSLAFRNG